MNDKTRHYLTQLLTAWAKDKGSGQGGPVPVPEGVDSAEISDILISHHIQVALAAYLPEEAQSLEYREHLASAKERTAFLLMELERIMPAISWSACKPIILKGAALAQEFYATADQRWFLDLDILVPPHLVDDVCSRLENIGYEAFAGGRDPLFYDLHHLHRMMVGPQGSCIEIHWDLTLPASIYRMDVPGVFNRAQTIKLGEYPALAASIPDQILHGVYQNIADGFLDIKRTLDLVLLVDRLTDEDKLYLVKEASRSKMNYALGLSLNIMKHVCGVDFMTSLPRTMIPGWATTRVLRGLDVELGLLNRNAEKVEGYASLMHLLMVPGQPLKVREGTRYIWRGEAELMDRGHWHDDLPGFGKRLRLSLYFLKTLLSLTGRSTWALFRG
ncbi:MAG: nucleotidyltransferase family protein [bacterium]|nr:nucleotidyltransferase family protein [bacterium]